jgi:hypothetical protein
VKHVPVFFKPPNGWKICRWARFYEHLKPTTQNKLGETDAFIVREFLKFLETLNMALITEISRDELRCLAKGVSDLRFKDVPDFSLVRTPFFEVANNFVAMLESVTEIAGNSKLRSKFSDRSRAGPKLSNWSKGSEKRQLPMIVNHIKLRKAHRGKWVFVGVGLTIDEVGRIDLSAFVTDRSLNWDVDSAQVKQVPKVLTLDAFSKWVIDVWGEILT